ncbi:hypothetical protein D3C72_1913550 [compost metagenome]
MPFPDRLETRQAGLGRRKLGEAKKQAVDRALVALREEAGGFRIARGIPVDQPEGCGHVQRSRRHAGQLLDHVDPLDALEAAAF